MKDALMMAVQITPEERDQFKNLARSRGMLVQGLLAQLVRREIKENTVAEPDLTPQGRDSHGARDSLSL